jgi:epoxyqueuosine reductase
MTQSDHLASERATQVKAMAQALGFQFCGISKADFLDEEAPRLEQWLKSGHHGRMAYMERHFDKRLDPRKLLEGTKSVISFLYNYFPEKKQPEGLPKISSYAYGEDYHEVIREKLKGLLFQMQEAFGDIHGRAFVDSAPVMDKVWAKKSGLGWVGKNTNLIRPKAGSWFFIGEILVDIDLAPDGPIGDFCGTCTRCIDACPTEALTPYQIEASKCISYFTIELKDAIPSGFSDKMENWMFGCDICQEVCPWNRFSTPHHETAFTPLPEIFSFSGKDWQNLTEQAFSEIFGKSPLKRPGLQRLKRNLHYLSQEKS